MEPSLTELRDGEMHLRLKGAREACPEREELPARYFDICLEDGTRVGNCELRIGRNGRTPVSGNIGFGVYPAWRGHHYAARAVKLLLRLATEQGMEEVLITCDPGNRASARSCELAGGIPMGTAEIPPEHPLYREGKRQVLVYRFSPGRPELREDAGSTTSQGAGEPAMAPGDAPREMWTIRSAR